MSRTSTKIHVSCLPLAGEENPYQRLMREGLAADERLTVSRGAAGKVFPLTRTAWSKRPDVIHLDWLHQYYLRASVLLTWISWPVFVVDLLLAKYLLGARFVWTLHNVMPHDSPAYGPYSGPRRFFARHCDWIRVFSEQTIERAAVVLGVGKNKFKVIPEGDYVGYYPNATSRDTSRTRFGLPQNARVLLFFGGIRPYKGIEMLIDTFIEIAREDSMYYLMIAGQARDSAYVDTLRDRTGNHDRIIFQPGMVAVADVQYFYHAADVVVLPFRKIENSGSAILAMGFGKAVVAPARGVLPQRLSAQPELLYDGELREALTTATSMSQEQLTAIGQANRNKLAEHQWTDFAAAFQV